MGGCSQEPSEFSELEASPTPEPFQRGGPPPASTSLPTFPSSWPPTPPPDLEMPPPPPELPGLGRNDLDPNAWLGFKASAQVLSDPHLYSDPYYFTGHYCPSLNPSDGHTSITSRVQVEGDPDEKVRVTFLGCAAEPTIQAIRPDDIWVIELAPDDINNPIIAQVRYDLPGWGSAVFYDVPTWPGFATILPTLLLRPSPEPSEWPFQLFSSVEPDLEFAPGYRKCDISPAQPFALEDANLKVTPTEGEYTTTAIIEMVNPYDFSIDVSLSLKAVDSDGDTVERLGRKKIQDLDAGERGRMVFDPLHPKAVDVRIATMVETNIWPKPRQDTDIELLDEMPLSFPPRTEIILSFRNNTNEERFATTKEKYYDSDGVLLQTTRGEYGLVGPGETRDFRVGTSGPYHAYVYLLDERP